jgi:hypothetical protein
MFVADGKKCLLEGAALNFSEEIGEFLVGSQGWSLVCFYELALCMVYPRGPATLLSRKWRSAHSEASYQIVVMTQARPRLRSALCIYHAVYRDILLDQRAAKR